MALYLVSYDLHGQRVYGPLIEALDDLKAVRAMDSVWLLTYSGSAAHLRDSLQEYVDHDDSLAVVELKPGSDWATLRTNPGTGDWLSRHLRA